LFSNWQRLVVVGNGLIFSKDICNIKFNRSGTNCIPTNITRILTVARLHGGPSKMPLRSRTSCSVAEIFECSFLQFTSKVRDRPLNQDRFSNSFLPNLGRVLVYCRGPRFVMD
jgi:hypothetical protein